jgi:hypothetical protein
MALLPRGRVAKWDREKIETLSTPELRQLMVNAEQLKEPEVAALCKQVLDIRPRGHASVRKSRPNGVRRLVSRGKAFEKRGVVLQSRTWSRGGVRQEDGVVVLAIPFEEVQKSEGGHSHLLWAPNVKGSHPWADKPGGLERLEHCRVALERGSAEGILVYAKNPDAGPGEKPAVADGVDADNVLNLKIEKRGEEYWATWADIRRATVTNMK